MGAVPPRFGTDGVRGVANTELTAEHVLRLGRAAARVLGATTVVVGRDTRRSSPMLDAALTAGLAAEGVQVVSAGVLPTPAVAWLAAERGWAGAVVTASHNPFADNGVKLFGPGGRKLADDVEAAVEAELHALAAPSRSGAAVGTVTADPGLADAYGRHLVDLFGPGALSGVRIVVDCANGAMSSVAPAVFVALGAEVIAMHAEPDGCNINDGGGATDTTAVRGRVLAEGADAGLAFDGDGDRVMAVDGLGRVLDGDRQMAVVAPALRAAGRLAGDAVVVTVMSNLGFRRAMAAAGIEVVETPVGDRYVLAELERRQLSLGGEQSGHLVYRDLATTGDGLLAGLVLLDLARRSGRPLAELAAAAMEDFPQVLVNVSVSQRPSDVVSLVAAEIADAEAELGDQGRILVRPSGTEPLVRVMVEAPTAEQARRTADRVASAVLARLG